MPHFGIFGSLELSSDFLGFDHRFTKRQKQLHQRTDPFIFVIAADGRDIDIGKFRGDFGKRPLRQFPLYGKSWKVGNITDAVLAATLKELIHDDLVVRRQYNEIPPRVEYALTEKGKSVVPILQSICKWAGIFQRGNSEKVMTQCQRCDFNR